MPEVAFGASGGRTGGRCCWPVDPALCVHGWGLDLEGVMKARWNRTSMRTEASPDPVVERRRVLWCLADDAAWRGSLVLGR